MAYNLEHIDPEERTELYADPHAEEEAPRSGRLLRIGGALLVMGVFAGGLWFAYTQGMHHAGGSLNGIAEAPLIRADTRPFKVKPENPGGMQIPDRDMLIYGQQHPEVEHLLPPPEQPMARPEPPPPAPPASPPQAQTAVSVPPEPASLDAASAQAASPSVAQAVPPATGSPPPVAAPLPRPEVRRPVRAMTSPEPDLIGERIEQLALAGANPQKAAPIRDTAEKTGGLRLQLGAVRSASEARGIWERLKRTNHDLLGNLSAVAIRADIADRGVYYRIQAGPISDPSTAERVCGELRQRHLACMIIR